jgi:hypothetical protein
VSVQMGTRTQNGPVVGGVIDLHAAIGAIGG